MSNTGLRSGCFDPYNAPGHFSKMPEWLELSPEVSLAARCVYARLVQHWGDVTEKRPVQKAYAGIATLSVELAISTSKVKRAIAELESLKLLLVIRRPTRNNRYFFLIHEWQKRTAKNVTGVGVGSLVRQRKDGRMSPPVSQQRSTRRPLASAGAPYKETPLEETHFKETKEGDQSVGELCSPLDDSLRSPSLTGASFTEDLSQTFLSPQLDRAANAVTLPQPPVPEIVSQPAPTFVTGEPVSEDDLKDDGLTSAERLARAKMHGEMREHKHVVTAQAKADKKRERNKLALANGELPKLKTPKLRLGEILLNMQNLWISEYRKKFPNDVVASSWTEVQGAQIKSLINRYSVDDVERAIRYFIRYWEAHQNRFFKKNPPLGPTVLLLTKLHESLMLESGRMFTALKAKTDYEEWCKKNPVAFRAPDDLQAAYDAALPSLKALGL